MRVSLAALLTAVVSGVADGFSGGAGHSVAVLQDGRVLLLGGWNNRPLGEVWRADASLRSWELVSNTAWEGRRGHSLVTLSGGGVLLLGGATNRRLGDVWRSDDGGSTWREVLPQPTRWDGRSGHTTVVTSSGDVVLMGGYVGDPGGAETPSNSSSYEGVRRGDVWRSRDGGMEWCDTSECACDPRPDNPACHGKWACSMRSATRRVA